MFEISNKKNYFFSFFSGITQLILSLIINIVYIPISLTYWNQEKYGLWSLFLSLIPFLNLLNFGLNSSAATLIGKNPILNQKLVILKRTLVLLIINALFWLIVFITINMTNPQWIKIFGKIPSNLMREAFKAFLFIGIFFFVNTPFLLASTVFQGFQKTYIENMFTMISTILNMVNLLITIYFKGSLVFFSIISGSTSFLLGSTKVFACYTIIKNRKELEKSENYQKECTTNNTDYEISYKKIIHTGFNFFLTGIAFFLLLNTDNIIITKYLGLTYVTKYSITYKVYQIIFSGIFIVISSIIPLMAKEFGLGNWEWIKKIYHRFSLILTILGGLLLIGGVAFLRDFISLWTNKESYTGLLTVVFFGAHSYIMSLISFNTVIVYYFNYMKDFFIIVIIEGLLKIFISIFLIKKLGISGVAIGTFFGSLLTTAWMIPVLLYRKSSKKLKIDYGFIIKHLFFSIFPNLLLVILLQLFLNNNILRLFLNFIIIVLYVIISYFIFPCEIKLYISIILKTMYSRVFHKKDNG